MEKVGTQAGRLAGNIATGGLFGLADMASGWLGGPSLSGIFANSTPGLDLSRGINDPGDQYDPARERASNVGSGGGAPKPPKAPDSPTGGAIQTQPTYRAKYKGPPKDLSRYGSGAETLMWEGDAYKDGGYVSCKKSGGRGRRTTHASGYQG
jgi:hypothetical protein